MKKYLVIGGLGFIGSHLVDKLIVRGNKVLIIDKLKSNRKINPKIKVFNTDVLNNKVLGIIKKEKPDVIYFLAGPIGLRKNHNKKEFIDALNIFAGFKKCIDACGEIKSKFIFVSSGGALYSKADKIPIVETCQVSPNSIYGSANLLLEEILKNSGSDYVILRLSNVYGPGQWQDGVIPSFIVNILNKKPFLINGSGFQTRDFLYIDDTVSALIKTGDRVVKDFFNVGSGKEASINELSEKIEKILKIKGTKKYNNSSEGVRRSALDYSKFKNEFNWSPKISLEEGLKKTIEYYERIITAKD